MATGERGKSLASHDHWHANTDARPFARCALNCEGAAHFRDTLLHGAQTQMPWKCPCRIKASAVVAHLQGNLVFLPCEPQDDGAGSRMLDSVVKGLLCDAVQGVFA